MQRNVRAEERIEEIQRRKEERERKNRELQKEAKRHERPMY